MYHTLQDLYSDDFESYTDSDTDDDVIQTNECISKQPIGTSRLNGSKKPCVPCVLPRHQRKSRFPVFDAGKILPVMKNKSLSETTKKLPTTVSASLHPKLLLPQRSKREPNRVKITTEKMTSKSELTPPEKKAKELNTSQHHVNPTEISPGSPSIKDEDDGLISFQFKPKLSIPQRRYVSRRCSLKTDCLPGKFINVQSPPCSSSSFSCFLWSR